MLTHPQIVCEQNQLFIRCPFKDYRISGLKNFCLLNSLNVHLRINAPYSAHNIIVKVFICQKTHELPRFAIVSDNSNIVYPVETRFSGRLMLSD
jgi:hypothetical protein